jgi:protein SCO1
MISITKSTLFLVGCFFILCTSCEENNNTIQKDLPYIGPVTLEEKISNGLIDTLHFTVPKWAFINQDSVEVSHRNYEGHVYVTDFFFSSCPSICPVMSAQMSRLQYLLKKKNLWGEVMLLSHTVDPLNDTPAILKIGADCENWNFVTGVQSTLYEHARNGYFMTALQSDTAAGGFFHSDNFVLVDQNKHLRGIYDGTSNEDVDRLFLDIQFLIEKEK